MIKLGIKMVVWVAMGFALMFGVGRLDIDAASPWQYQLTATDAGISVHKSECLCQECKEVQYPPLDMLAAVNNVSHRILSETPVNKTLDVGVLGSCIVLYGAGTLMGRGSQMATDDFFGVAPRSSPSSISSKSSQVGLYPTARRRPAPLNV